MITNIKNSEYPNNIYLDVNGIGWKHSNEIMQLNSDHIEGANRALNSIKRKVDIFIIRDRYENKMTYKELSEKYKLSESKCSQLVNEQIQMIKDDSKLKKYILKGYNYTRNHM